MFKNIDVEERNSVPAGGYARAAVVDAKKKNAMYISEHSSENKSLAMTIEEMVGDVYYRSRRFVNYRKKFIAVKVANVTQKDIIENRRGIRALEELCIAEGVTIHKVGSNMIFRIHKGKG